MQDNTIAFPQKNTPEYDLLAIVQSLLSEHIVNVIQGKDADQRIKGGLQELFDALDDDSRGNENSESFKKKTEDALKDKQPVKKEQLTDKLNETLKKKGDLIKKDGGTETPPTTTPPVADATRYHLLIYLTRVKAHRLTEGFDVGFVDLGGADEFRVSGGYTYHNAQIGLDGVARDKTLSTTAWEQSFDDNGDDTNDDTDPNGLPHMLVSEAIPPGKTFLVVTLTPTEKDAVSTKVAQAIGKFASILFTAGIDLLVGLAVAAGHTLVPGAASLSAEAQSLIRDHATPGLVGLIRKALGPELFQMPVLRVDSDWTPGTAVNWTSWAWYPANRTHPHISQGAAEHKGSDVSINEIEIEPDDNGVLRQTRVNNGGFYELEFLFRVTEV